MAFPTRWPLAAVLLTCAAAAGADASPQEPTLPCGDEQLAMWSNIREHMDDMLPRHSGRLSFVLLRSDLPAIEGIQKELLERMRFPDALLQAQAGETWTECHSALLAVRALLLMTQVTGQPQSTPVLAAALVGSVMAAPWLDVLLSGWQVFTILAILARWASPHLDARSARASGSQGRSAGRAASHLKPSGCDAAETGAALLARQTVGRIWRHRDPGFAESSPEGLQAREIEEALAGLKGFVAEGSFGGHRCRWTEHLGRYLGGSLAGYEDVGPIDKDEQVQLSRFNDAMTACYKIPECAGVTAEPSESPTLVQRLSLRLGEPLLAGSPNGESSFVKWCTPASIGSSGEEAPCPLGKAVGLLGTAVRRLGDDAALDSFAPELVREAQDEVLRFASSVGKKAEEEVWSSQWPILQVLGRLQQRLDLLRENLSKPGHPTWLQTLQRAVGFDDEAWRLARRELEKLAQKAKVPAALRESVRCVSGPSCVAELFGRLHVMMHASDLLPIRDPIFVNNDDAILPEMMIKSKSTHDGLETDMDYDWLKLLREAETDRKAEHSDGLRTDRMAEINSMMPLAHPLQVDRMQLAHFILEVRDNVTQAGPMRRCLEWDQPFLLVRAFSAHCRWMDVYSYSEPSPEDPRLGLPGRHEYNAGTRHYWGDMEKEENFGVDPESLDLILCPFVFEHVSQPWVAIKTLAGALRPGGFVIWAAPMFQQYHGSPHDYYRYTPKGILALAAHAELEVVKVWAPGDLSLATGVMMGMMLPYWTEEEVLSESDPVEGEDSPRHPMNVFALLRKPGTRPDIGDVMA